MKESRINTKAGAGEVCQLRAKKKNRADCGCLGNYQWVKNIVVIVTSYIGNTQKKTQNAPNYSATVDFLFYWTAFQTGVTWLSHHVISAGCWGRQLPSCHRSLLSCYFVWASALMAPGFPLQTRRSTSWKWENQCFCTPVARKPFMNLFFGVFDW